MKTNTQTIDIDAPVEIVFSYISDGKNLPGWTNGFIREAVQAGDGWEVDTTRGPAIWRISSNAELGTIDFLAPTPKEIRPTYARVIPRGDHATVIFTMIQWPEITDDVFSTMKTALQSELLAIKTATSEGHIA